MHSWTFQHGLKHSTGICNAQCTMPSGSLVTLIPQADNICSAKLGLLDLMHLAIILDFSVANSCPNPWIQQLLKRAGLADKYQHMRCLVLDTSLICPKVCEFGSHPCHTTLLCNLHTCLHVIRWLSARILENAFSVSTRVQTCRCYGVQVSYQEGVDRAPPAYW